MGTQQQTFWDLRDNVSRSMGRIQAVQQIIADVSKRIDYRSRKDLTSTTESLDGVCDLLQQFLDGTRSMNFRDF